MSETPTLTTDELPGPSSSPSRSPESTTAPCLDPAGTCPSDLSGLSLVELHVWHSRVSGQLSRDSLDPVGPHPVTLDRHRELAAELDARGDWLAPPGTAV